MYLYTHCFIDTYHFIDMEYLKAEFEDMCRGRGEE